jgi:hypothetical protein
MTFGPSIATAAPQFAALSGHTGAEYKQQQNFRELLLNRNYVILISTKYVILSREFETCFPTSVRFLLNRRVTNPS